MMATWERRPHIEDLDLVRAALQEANLPVTDPVLDFHRTFAGYVTDVWGDEGVLGIIHREVGGQSWYTPMAVGGYLTGRKPLLACAEIHMSWEMMIGLDGTFYCNGPEASSYFMWTERSAFLQEFSQARKWEHVPLWLRGNVNELNTVLLPRLKGTRIDELSDRFAQVFVTDDLVVILKGDDHYDAWVVEGADPPELRGLTIRDRTR
jgi:hypothetical protein